MLFCVACCAALRCVALYCFALCCVALGQAIEGWIPSMVKAFRYAAGLGASSRKALPKRRPPS